MQYLIIYAGKAYYTKWFEAENHFVEGMTVIDLVDDKYTTDGKNWIDIEFDHL